MKKISKKLYRMAQAVFSFSLILLLVAATFLPYFEPEQASAVAIVTVDSQAEFANGTQDGNLVIGDMVRLDGQAPGLTHDEDAEFNQEGHRNWESVASGDHIELDNADISKYHPTSTLPIFAYFDESSPNYYNSYYDSANGILYLPVSNTTDDPGGGLNVINTQGTFDESDDVFIAQYKASGSVGTSVTLPRNQVQKVLFDGDFMYVVAPGDGISVINTQGTLFDASDDVLEFTYTTASTPALSHAFVYDIYKDTVNDLLYIVGFSGVDVFSDAGTPGVIGDDSDLGTLASGFGLSIEFFDDHLYVGGGTGLEVYDRNGTPAAIGGYTNTSYTTGSSPAISDNFVRSTQIEAGYIYVETGSGLDVIGMGGDGEPGGGDDTLVTTYNSGNLLPSDNISDAALDPDQEILAIAQREGGVSIIEFGGDAVPGGGDDSLVVTYDDSTEPALEGNWVNDVSFASDGTIVISGGSFAAIISADANPFQYKNSGAFVGPPLRISSTPSGEISWSETVTGDHSVSLQTRAGDESVFFYDDHDDAALPTVTNSEFGSLAEAGTSLDFTDSTPCFGFCAADWEVSSTPDFYSENATVSMRVRFTSGTGAETPTVFLRTDQGEASGAGDELTSGVWQTITMSPSEPFNQVGFQSQPFGESGHVDDVYEIDWIKVDVHDGVWGSWSSSLSDEAGEIVETDTTGMTWLQYRVNSTTSDISTTPEVPSISLAEFEGTGQYFSQIFDGGTATDWQDLTADTTTPDDTSIAFYTRTGNVAVPDGSWSAWELVNSPIASPDAQYMQFRADFTTAAASSTPQLDSVTITYDAAAAPSANDGNSTLSASPTSITADGISTSTITATVRDGSNSLLPGQTVVINTDAGSIGSVSDQGDGTYTATLTSAAVAGTANLSFAVNGDPFSDTATVDFTDGNTDTATINPPTSVSEQTLNVTITPDTGVGSAITKIHYTLDESEVTESSPLYGGALQISKKGTTVVKWKGYNDTSDPLDSGTETYYLPNTTITPNCHYPETQQCFGPQSFTFSTAESDETILYTTDNTHPILGDPIFTDPDPNTEEFFAGAREVGPGEMLKIGMNTKVRFASRNRFGQVSPVYYRHSVLNFPHILTMPDLGANAHVMGYRHDGLRAETPNFILEQFSKNGGSIATGDLNGDGRDEIIMSPGKGKTTDLYVFSYHETGDSSAEKELILLAFKKDIYGNENIKTGLSIAAADINGNGREEIITVPKEGAESRVLVHEYRIDPNPNGGPGNKYLRRTTDGGFLAYGFSGDYTEDYTRGAEIAAADLDGNGTTEIITSSDSGQIRIFDKRGNQTFSLGFHPYGKLTRRALKLAIGDVTGDNIPEIITIPKEGNPHVLFVNRFGQRVFTPNFVPDVNKGQEENEIATADMDFDLKPEVIVQDKDLDGKPILKVFDPETQAAKPFYIKPNYPGYTGGLTIATGLWSGRE